MIKDLTKPLKQKCRLNIEMNHTLINKTIYNDYPQVEFKPRLGSSPLHDVTLLNDVVYFLIRIG